MLYHKTKDPYYLKDSLGHKCLSETEIYINIERTLFEDQSHEFTVKVAEKPEDTKALLEAGIRIRLPERQLDLSAEKETAQLTVKKSGGNHSNSGRGEVAW